MVPEPTISPVRFTHPTSCRHSGSAPTLQVLTRLGLLLVYVPAAGFLEAGAKPGTQARCLRYRPGFTPASMEPAAVSTIRWLMFDPVPSSSSVSLPKQEEKIIRFWKERQIYEKTLAARAGAPPFVFYEGPPTANGLPHPGHCLTRAIKDLFPRYKTMRGFLLPAQGRLGHARSAGRSRGLQGTGHPRQGGNRGLRRRAVHPQVHRERFPLHAAVGRTDRTARLLDPSRRGLRHLPPELRGERLVGPQDVLRARPALPGTQDRLVVGPGRHGPLQRRGRAGLPRSGRPQRVSCGSRWSVRPLGRGRASDAEICSSGPPPPGRCRATIRRGQAGPGILASSSLRRRRNAS